MPRKATGSTPKKKAKRGPPRKPWKDVFLATLAETINVSEASRAAGVDRRTAYAHRESDPEFAARWDAALDGGLDDAEGEVYRRGVKGVDRPVFQGGKRVGTVRDYSDTLLIFLLKSRRRQVYGDKSLHEISGPDGAPLGAAVEAAIEQVYGEQAGGG